MQQANADRSFVEMAVRFALCSVEFGIITSSRGVAQPGSAPQWGCGGRRFESSRPDHLFLMPKTSP